MSETSPQLGEISSEFTTLSDALHQCVSCLKETPITNGPELNHQAAEAMAILASVLRRVDQTIVSQLEVLGKSHPKVKDMAETLKEQNLLNIDAALQGIFNSNAKRMTRLHNYAELLFRWWSAILAGVQTTVLELPNELADALNPANWEVEKKRWGSEEAAYWDHYKFSIRPGLPLKSGDRLKTIQAKKTLDAYAILGGSQRAPEPNR